MATTPIQILLAAPTGLSLWGRVTKPDNSVGSEAAVPETPAGSGVYESTQSPDLADATAAASPCHLEVREGTDATTFAANTTKVWGPRTSFWVKAGLAVDQPILCNLDALVSSAGGSGGGTIISEGESVSSTDAVT